ncbi:MAG: chitobiase/beta-hexosaminidase C-terminal domain-containing protein [Oscillospiraceae bacterium]|nr:chitobiase/beta-hexosaminidase C-terminal domain-containing protein [Oscillospiraceae bacterium]
MKKAFKKLMAMVLAAIIIVAVIPTAALGALAAELNDDVTEPPEEYIDPEYVQELIEIINALAEEYEGNKEYYDDEVVIPESLMDPYFLQEVFTAVYEPAIATNAMAFEASDTEMDISEKFTDPNFLAAVKDVVNKYPDEPIYPSDVDFYEYLDVSGMEIASLDGIEYFASLCDLDCSDNNLTQLDLSGLNELLALDCSNNMISYLDLTGLAKLQLLDCTDNQMTMLFVWGLQDLRYINCANNKIESLRLEGLSSLESLDCTRNELNMLDISDLDGLQNLRCAYNKIADDIYYYGNLPKYYDCAPQLTDVLEQDGPKFTPAMSYTNEGDTGYTVTIQSVKGMEYSFDGEYFSDINYITGCTPGETVTGYIRYAAIPATAVEPAYAASIATSASTTPPLFRAKRPQATPEGQTFYGSIEISLSSDTNGASIYYTTDGSVPTTASKLYTGPFTLTASATLKAIAVKSGMVDSYVLTATFNRQTGEFSLDGKESATLMPDDSSGKKGLTNDTSFERDLIVEVVDGNSVSRIVPKDININKTQYVVKIPKIQPGASIRISIAGIPGEFDPLVIAEHVNNTNKTMNGSFHFVLEPNPVTRARQQNISGLDCKKLADVLLREFGLGAEYTAQVMAGEGFSAGDVAEMLRDAGFEAVRIARAMDVAYGLTSQETADMLFGLGIGVLDAAEAVADIYFKEKDDLLDILQIAEYSPANLAFAIKDYFEESLEDTARQLDRLGYNTEEIADLLIDTYDTDSRRIAVVFANELEYEANVIFDLLLTHYEESYEDALRYMNFAGFEIGELSLLLIDTLAAQQEPEPMMARFTAISPAIADIDISSDIINEGVTILIEAFPGGDRASGTGAEIVDALMGIFDIDIFAGTILDLLGADNYAEIFVVLLDLGINIAVDALTRGVSDIAALAVPIVRELINGLEKIGIKSDTVFGALTHEGLQVGLEFLELTANLMTDVFGVPKDYLVKWIVHGDFDPHDIFDCLDNMAEMYLNANLEWMKTAGAWCDNMAAYLQGRWGIAGDAAAFLFRAKAPLRVWAWSFGYWGDLLDLGRALYNLDFIYFLKNVYKITGIGGILRILEVTGVIDMATVEKLFTEGLPAAVNYLASLAAGGLKWTADEIVDGFWTVYGYSAVAAGAVVKAMEYTVEEIAGAFKYVYSMGEYAAGEVLKALNYTTEAVASAFRWVYGCSAEYAGQMLKQLGYVAIGVATAYKQVYEFTEQQVGQALRALDYAADQVAEAFKSVYGYTADAAGQMLRGLGYAADQIASAFNLVYNIAGEAAAKMLQGLGFAANEIAGALNTVYHFSAEAAATVLDGLGYAGDTVVNAVTTAYQFTEDTAKAFAKYLVEGLGYAKDFVNDALGAIGGFFSSIGDWFSSWWPF